MPHTGQLLSGGESCGTTADDGNRFAGKALGRNWMHPAFFPRLVNDRHLNLLDGHWRLVDTQYTGRLTRSRAEATGELREVVGFVESLDSLAPVTSAN
jgi:hypothetical protein